MNFVSTKPGVFLLAAALAAPAAVIAQTPGLIQPDGSIMVEGAPPPADLSGLAEGPVIEGIIAARRSHAMQVTGADGANTAIAISTATEIKGKGGFLGLERTVAASDALLTGLPVTVRTVQWEGGLVASRISYRNSDFRMASMIHNGTAQRFAEHDVAIEENAAATEALRGRVGDIDQYNIKGAANVYFDTGKWQLSSNAQAELCAIASDAAAMDNALLLVVGYTDSVGNEDYNQVLSERRAGRVVNYLQQQCRWAPWRMLTPTGMAESDPLADNTTATGRAQNRRVSVNILVSKAVDGI